MKSLLRIAVVGAFFAAFLSCHNDSTAPTQPAVTTGTPVPIMTPTPAPMMTPTPAPNAAHMVSVGLGGLRFVDAQSGTSTTTVHVGDTVTWNWVSGPHSTTSGTCCTGDGNWNSGIMSTGSFSHKFTSAGSFPYFCMVHLQAMTGQVVVQP